MNAILKARDKTEQSAAEFVLDLVRRVEEDAKLWIPVMKRKVYSKEEFSFSLSSVDLTAEYVLSMVVATEDNLATGYEVYEGEHQRRDYD